MAALLSLGLAGAANAAVIHVKPGGAGAMTGSSWLNARAHPQDAVDAAMLGDEIWVAAGTYTDSDFDGVVVAMRDGTWLYGGFAGGETARDQRNVVTNQTILDGEYGCNHVVEAADAAILDGFVVTRGDAWGTWPDNVGGGMQGQWCNSLVVANCTFTDNSADYGGAIHIWYGSLTVEACTFVNNTAGQSGGAIEASGSAPLSLSGLVFTSNTSSVTAGAARVVGLGGYATISDCAFNLNGSDQGGGLELYHATANVIDCTFDSNSASYGGGGAAVFGAAASTFTGCTFTGNTAANRGGALLSKEATPEFTTCDFLLNSAPAGGGAIAEGDDSTFTDCTFGSNSATRGGGLYALYVDTPGCSTDLALCTFDSNDAQWGGGFFSIGSAGSITDSIFAGNTADYGAGLYAGTGSTHTTSGCTFTANAATWEGGGSYSWETTLTATEGCTFTSNTADSGGAIGSYESPGPITNCLFDGNSAAQYGGAVFSCESSPSLSNCTVTGNRAFVGGGVAVYSNSAVSMKNCIFWGDSAPITPEIWINATSSGTVDNSCVEGGYAGSGNTSDDPLFVAPGGWDDNGTPGDESDDLWVPGDCRLQEASPCIDAADGNAAPTLDIVDVGRHDDPGSDDIGVGTPTFADIGAYEFTGTSARTLTLTSPVGGETWTAGLGDTVTWTCSGGRLLGLNVLLSRDGGTIWEGIDGGSPAANTGSFDWALVTGPGSDTCLVRISAASTGTPSDESASTFTILEPDGDSDTMPDWWEILHGLNAGSPSDATGDPDGDGLLNEDEYIWGTDPDDPDSDGDWTRDGDEVEQGYDPADPASHPPRPPSSGCSAGEGGTPPPFATLLIALALLSMARPRRACLGD